jgi:hypothetical protein
MLNCSTCGYESPDSAKFCRRCGAPLLGEDEQLEATRRMQDRQYPAALGSHPLPPSIGDAVAGPTLRYQQPLPAVQPAYVPPSGIQPTATNTSRLKSKRRYLKWGGFLLALFISAGIGAAINEESNSDRVYLSPTDRARLARLHTEDRVNRAVTGSVAEQQERIDEYLERRLEEIERAKEDAEKAAERNTAAISGEKALDLTAYEYQGASVGQYSRIPGRELLLQRTKDSFESVSRFYQERLGAPLIQVSERNQRQAVFQSASAPAVAVLVREGRDRSRQLEIITVRSPLPVPIIQPAPPQPKTEGQRSASPEAKQKTAPQNQ